jgi:hypothetical protein
LCTLFSATVLLFSVSFKGASAAPVAADVNWLRAFVPLPAVRRPGPSAAVLRL